MSNYIYYSSGEHIDGEYTLPTMDAYRPKRTDVQNANPIDIPKEFDIEYYKQKRDKYSTSSTDYWEWDNFLKYSIIVFNFYTAVCNEFYARYPMQDDAIKFVKLTDKDYNLQELNDALIKAEISINRQFYNAGRTIAAKLNKHATLRNLKDRATEAIVRYSILKDNLFVDNNFKFKQSYLEFDFNNPIDAIRCIRGAAILKRNQAVFITNKKLLNNNGHNSELYDDVNVNSVYMDVLSGIGALTTADLDEILIKTEPYIDNLSKNKDYADLITFYKNFDNMHLLAYYINKINEKYQGAQMIHFGAFDDVGGFEGDIYVLASNYLTLINNLSQTTTYALFLKDINLIKDKLQNALTAAHHVYIQSI